MVIKTKLTEQDFIKVTLIILYGKPFIKIISILMLLSLLVAIVSFFVPLSFAGDASITRITTPVLILIVLPAMTYFGARRNYSSNKRMAELIEYQLDNNYLIIQGESFNAQFTWDKIYKVTQTHNWILIWQTRQSANAIHKSDIWEGEIDELKAILTAHGVKNNLS
jgi:hypothetical protein